MNNGKAAARENEKKTAFVLSRRTKMARSAIFSSLTENEAPVEKERRKTTIKIH